MEECRVKMLLVHANNGGLFLALVPAILDSTQIHSAFAEMGITPSTLCEIHEWRTTSQDVAVADLRFPGLN